MISIEQMASGITVEHTIQSMVMGLMIVALFYMRTTLKERCDAIESRLGELDKRIAEQRRADVGALVSPPPRK